VPLHQKDVAHPTWLAEIHQDDIDELFSLRLSSKECLWGILDNHILKILWWNMNHEVWPSKKETVLILNLTGF